MRVKKRNGSFEEVSFDKIILRLQLLSNDLNVDCGIIAQKVVSRMSDNMSTRELDELSSQLCMEMITNHLDYGTLGSRIAIDNHHKNTKNTLLESFTILYNNKDILGKESPLINKKIYTLVQQNNEKIEEMIDYKRDFLINYFGFKTLCKSYLLKINK